MSKMTRNDLQKKSAFQLAALFQQAMRQASPDKATLSHIRMIRAEMQRRGPAL